MGLVRKLWEWGGNGSTGGCFGFVSGEPGRQLLRRGQQRPLGEPVQHQPGPPDQLLRLPPGPQLSPLKQAGGGGSAARSGRGRREAEGGGRQRARRGAGGEVKGRTVDGSNFLITMRGAWITIFGGCGGAPGRIARARGSVGVFGGLGASDHERARAGASGPGRGGSAEAFPDVSCTSPLAPPPDLAFL